MISERIKYQAYNKVSSNNYFWRTYEQQEIDWVEERGGELFGYEMKWKEDKVKVPSQWKDAYPDASFQVINNSNFEEWLKP
jgi:hypothetical protein